MVRVFNCERLQAPQITNTTNSKSWEYTEAAYRSAPFLSVSIFFHILVGTFRDVSKLAFPQ